MLGAIVGDTVGSIYEFENTKDYNFEMFTDRSGYTDDSIMTMAVAYWLLKDPEHKYETLEEAIIAFLESSSFEDAIRKVVSMGGDSDTLACITGGIAEAFYGEIPEEMILETKRVFPQIFHKILDAMKINTAYGKQNK